MCNVKYYIDMKAGNKYQPFAVPEKQMYNQNVFEKQQSILVKHNCKLSAMAA